MKYILIAPGYPSKEHLYSNAFVHVRVKNYIEHGLNIEVFSVDRKPLAKPKDGMRYIFDGVEVECGNISDLKKKLEQGNYDKILIHFALKKVVSCVLETLSKTPVIIWCHGVDVIAWHRRLYNMRLTSIVKFAGYSVLNTLQRIYIRKVAIRESDRVSFVFVSQWLKKIAQKDLGLNGRMKNVHVIPNIVDEEMFSYRTKTKEDRLKILSIRAFSSRNYANDLTAKAIHILSKKPYFNELEFTICGEGRLWDSVTNSLKVYDNVALNRRFYTHQEISALHNAHGVMLMPSRQDTHGVSTCEGMSSGLVPISSNNSAIPEYVPATCGYLTNSAQELADAIDDLYHHPEKFLEYSRKSAEYVRRVCGTSTVISKELELISCDKTMLDMKGNT